MALYRGFLVLGNETSGQAASPDSSSVLARAVAALLAPERPTRTQMHDVAAEGNESWAADQLLSLGSSRRQRRKSPRNHFMGRASTEDLSPEDKGQPSADKTRTSLRTNSRAAKTVTHVAAPGGASTLRSPSTPYALPVPHVPR